MFLYPLSLLKLQCVMLDKTGKNFHLCVYLNLYITSLQASSPGPSGSGAAKRKERLQLLCIEKVDAKCLQNADWWI